MKKTISIFIICLLFGILTTNPTANANKRWNHITSDKNINYFFDSYSVQEIKTNKGKTITAWVLMEFTKKYGKEFSKSLELKKPAFAVLSHWEIDAKNRRYKILETTTYDKDGNELEHETTTKPFLPLITGTNAEHISKYIYKEFYK